jgi:hypothetical protein
VAQYGEKLASMRHIFEDMIDEKKARVHHHHCDNLPIARVVHTADIAHGAWVLGEGLCYDAGAGSGNVY